jgi:hypothetical protein
LSRPGRSHPQLEAMQPPAVRVRLRRGHLGVDDPGAGRHPLDVAWAEAPAVVRASPCARTHPREVGNRLEAAVRVIWRSFRLARTDSTGPISSRSRNGSILLEAELRERPANDETAALEGLDCYRRRVRRARTFSTSAAHVLLLRLDLNQRACAQPSDRPSFSSNPTRVSRSARAVSAERRSVHGLARARAKTPVMSRSPSG